jgi:hypothetical protein
VRNNTTGSKFLLTAGHCAAANQNATWYVGYGSSTCFFFCSQYNLGHAIDTVFQTGSNYDAADFYISGQTDTRNWAYYSTSAVVVINAIGNFGDTDTDVVGAVVCNSDGHADLYPCGSVHSTNTTVNYPAEAPLPAVTLYNQRLSTAYDEAGDSGSPVDGLTNNSTTKAVGIVSGTVPDAYGNFVYCIYSHIQYVQSGLGVTVATS